MMKHPKKKYRDLFTTNILDHATIMISYNAAIDAIREPNTKNPPHTKSLIRVDNATACS